MKRSGKAVVYGDDISTDLLYPGRYTYHLLSVEQMAEHALEDLDPSFAKRDVAGMFLVAGSNFGCGSAREQAVQCLKAKGIGAIVAKSISRIYYRNCINEGLIPVICPEAVDLIQNADMLRIDAAEGVLQTPHGTFSFPKFPAFVLGILENGGLIPSIQAELSRDSSVNKDKEAAL
jgi:3-isopropylmalate/(R)-2-methylmalate dehydratase small subunit